MAMKRMGKMKYNHEDVHIIDRCNAKEYNSNLESFTDNVPINSAEPSGVENKGQTIRVFCDNLYRISQSPVVDFIEHYRNIYSTPDNFLKRKVDYGRMKVANEKYRQESERLNSFRIFPNHLSHLIRPIAKSGFYSTNNCKKPDEVKCIYCQGILSGWKKCDRPEKVHKKSFPTCPFLLYLNVSNQIVDEKIEMQNISIQDPDLKDFNGEIPYVVVGPCLDVNSFDGLECGVEYRESTFTNLDHLKYLALDGIFVDHRNKGDFLKCYKCKKEVEILANVERLTRKIFHREECDYYQLIQNELLFTEKDKTVWAKEEPPNQNKLHCHVEYSITDAEIEGRLDSIIINKIEKIKVNHKRTLKGVISMKLKRTGNDYDSIFELLTDLENYTENTEEPSHTNTLESVLTDHDCVVCLDNPIAVVFLPCGHMKACGSCSSLLSNCPICREIIVKRVFGIQFT